MQILTSENVETIFLDCLFKDGEDTSTAVKVKGILNDFGFHPDRLKENEDLIYKLLKELPDQFQMDGGGGWSFLQACIDKDGHQWGEHRNMEQLFVLGIAIKKAEFQLPRELWSALPGGMPYVEVL